MNYVRHERVTGDDGVSLHIARAGAGPPVVLLHGFPENWRSWRHQIGPLADAGLGVHAVDLRGYNRSDRPRGRGAYRLRHLVADVAAVVRATGHERAHIVGHDWGGVIAWAFAGAHPELLDRLVIMNAPHLGIFARQLKRPQQLLRSWYTGFFQLPLLPELALRAGDWAALRSIFRKTPARPRAFSSADIEAYVAAMAQPGALRAALNYYRALPLDSGLARHARTDAPTLVIWGERDRALRRQLLDGTERYAPDLRVARLPDVGHWVQNEAPAEVNTLLLEFLRAPPAPDRGCDAPIPQVR